MIGFFRLGQIPPSVILTDSQIKSQSKWNINWNSNWKRFVKLKLLANLKSFLFKCLNNVNTWQVSSECKCGLTIESFWHILDCNLLIPIKKYIIRKLFYWTKYKPSIDKEHTIKLANNPKSSYVTLLAIWSLWNVRNKMIYENMMPLRASTSLFMQKILKRLINFHFHKLDENKFNNLWINNNSFIRIENNKVEFEFN